MRAAGSRVAGEPASRSGPSAPGASGPRRVVGTAGHIDHGKTALVAALTGVATDRLPEEKARGISIDLGFAPLDLGPEADPASVVDVPGHEGFIKNMVAGATGIDAVLLTVAADEGMMPQTHEHLLVLKALGVDRGVVAVTKADLVEPEWAELVAATVAEGLAGTPLAGAPIVVVSAETREGIERLRSALEAVLAETPGRPADFPFRMPVDRAFAVPGAGTVVTGTVWSGRLAAGGSVVALPGGARARARSIEVHGAAVPGTRAGSRTAIALAGPGAGSAVRGTTLVGPEPPWRPVRRIDALLWLAGSAARPLRPGARVRVHHGTSEVMARVRPYDGAAVEPGGEGVAVLSLEAELVPAVGDRFVLRAYSPARTIGGGTIVALEPPRRRGSARAERGARLAALGRAAASGRVLLAVEAADEAGIDAAALPLETGLGSAALAAALAAAGPALESHGGRWFARAAREKVEERLASALARHHAERPLEAGLSLESVRAAGRPAAGALVEASIATLESAGRVRRHGAALARAEHRIELADDERRIAEALESRYRQAGLEAPDTEGLAADLALDPRRLRDLLGYLERKGAIVKLASDWYADAAAIEAASAKLGRRLAERGHADTGDCKELFGVSRKYLIPILEYFDRTGLTRREGNRRVPAGSRGR